MLNLGKREHGIERGSHETGAGWHDKRLALLCMFRKSDDGSYLRLLEVISFSDNISCCCCFNSQSLYRQTNRTSLNGLTTLDISFLLRALRFRLRLFHRAGIVTEWMSPTTPYTHASHIASVSVGPLNVHNHNAYINQDVGCEQNIHHVGR